ncbi:MAG: glycosyltransferase family 2 protein [Methylococcaceae bacterium]|nr:glycosyltransferase family 2 protein [Methylococcaceae bacterium]MCI0733260.1 glycosyltransferase family 2 protein [Methylococcaceae bacterium]
MSESNKLSVYIIAYNEADKIVAAIRSVSWADEIIVADSGSTDGMIEKAESLGARVVQIPFQGFGDLRNRAIEHCRSPWIFSLDADERCTPELADEILGVIRSADSSDVYRVPRRNYFMGRWIRHSGWYPNYRQPQLFRKGTLKYTLEPVHEGFELLTDRPIGHLKEALWQVPFANLDEVIHKAGRYSTLGADKLAERNVKPGMGGALLRAFWSFFKHFVLKRGFLDGWPGFVIAFGNFEGTFYKNAKLYCRSVEWVPAEEEALRRGVPSCGDDPSAGTARTINSARSDSARTDSA